MLRKQKERNPQPLGGKSEKTPVLWRMDGCHSALRRMKSVTSLLKDTKWGHPAFGKMGWSIP